MAYDETPGQRDEAGKHLEEEEASSSSVRSTEQPPERSEQSGLAEGDAHPLAGPDSSSSSAVAEDGQWHGAAERTTEIVEPWSAPEPRNSDLTEAEPVDGAAATPDDSSAAEAAQAERAALPDASAPAAPPVRPSGPPSPWARSGDQSPTEQLPTGTLNPTPHSDPAPGGYAGVAPRPVPSGYPAYQPVAGYPAYSAPTGPPTGPPVGQPGGQPGVPSYPGGQPPPGAVFGLPGHGGPPMYGPPTTPGPAGGGSGPRESSRRKLVIAGVVLALLAALFGGGLGGMVGYQIAASGGHLSVLDGPSPDADSTAAPEGAVEQIAQRTLASVVQIRVTAGQQAGAGSGMVLSPDGLILTNNHVISMAVNGGTVNVLFQDGRIAPAKIIGRNKTFDIAVVQAQNVSGLQPIKLGNSDSVRVGQSVVAIGSPLGLGGTVTSGIVSALNRAVSVGGDDDGPDTPPPPGLPPGLGPNSGLPNPNAPPDSNLDNNEVLNAIQTDASINPGNSGGPLVDLEGNVVGMNTAIASLASSGQGGSVGLGFSTPINQVKRIAQELQNSGRANKAVIGVKIETRPQTGPLKGTTQAAVVEVSPGSPASQSTLKSGDVITKVDQRTVTSANEVVAAVLSHAPGDKVTLTLSDGRTVDIVLGSQPSN